MRTIFRTKSIEALLAASEEPGKRLAKTLGPWSLMALGIGAVIGSGIFTLTGTAAAGSVQSFPSLLHASIIDILSHGSSSLGAVGRLGAGPGLALSFLFTAIACCFAGLCYAEMASAIPVSGSAYTYTYATLGEVFAWLIGWNLILEYAVSNMAVAVGFSDYFNVILKSTMGFQLPPELSQPIFIGDRFTGAWFNLPALLVIMVLTWILVFGIRESATANTVMVLVKLLAILIFVSGAAKFINTENWHPFLPNGYPGVLTGAAIVFFTYIGFDSVSTAAEECRKPQRDLPIGIIGTLVVCSVLYISVVLVLTGIANYKTLNNAAPVATALEALKMTGILRWVSVGAAVGMLSSLLVFQYGQARVWFAMSRDGLLPRFFSRVHPKHRTPHVSTWIAGLAVGIPAGVWDIGTFAELSNIGTLFAFVVVSIGVIVLRKTDPGRPRSFRVPFGSLFPILSIACCVILMLALPLQTWLRFISWSALGLAFYWVFGRKRSALAQPERA